MTTSRVFHEASIGGMKFKALLSADGPYVASGHRGVALGRCTSINRIRGKFDSEEAWWIVKYDDQPRIRLDGFSDEDVARISKEFGIPLSICCHVGRLQKLQGARFQGSPAAESLREWVSAHPIVAKKYSRYCNYIHDWYESATRSLTSTGKP